MLVVQWLGSIGYQQAWDMQVQLADEIARRMRPPTLLLLEHPHTYTFGRSGHAKNLLWSEAELERRGVQVHWVDRGGDITYHGPGQLVGYPLLPLAPPDWNTASTGHLPQADYVGYLRRLEKALIDALADLGLVGCQAIDGLTGVWVPGSPQPAKIAAIGVKVDARHLATRLWLVCKRMGTGGASSAAAGWLPGAGLRVSSLRRDAAVVEAARCFQAAFSIVLLISCCKPQNQQTWCC
jgi:lipoate-protein ligase B